MGYINASDLVSGTNASAITNTTSTEIIPAPGAGQVLSITDILVTNSHASVGTVVQIRSGTTLKWQGYARAEGGFACPLGVEIVCGVNEAINAQCVTTGASVFVSINGFERRS
jgi:hypothetical protein